MSTAILLFALKIVMLVAATAQTAGFIGLFAIEALGPYKWQLMIGGMIAIMVSESATYLLVKRMATAAAATDVQSGMATDRN